jgi:Tfp pilus tip-associated adhesin PilY1
MFAHMDAAFTGSIAGIDLDGDGLHDRLYAGDMSARVWRLDLHHGADAPQWATGGIYADFSNTEGRGFLAAPDISLSAPPGGSAWINIAIGTAAPGNPAANNRFYALRDHAAYAAWTSEEYAHWQPLRETSLLRVEAIIHDLVSAPNVDTSSPGWYVELGSGHVLTPSITVADRAVLVVAATVPRGGSCEVFARVASLDLLEQRPVPASTPGQWSTDLAMPVPGTATFGFGTLADNVAPCLLAGQRIAACDVDTRPRKTWWRRSDAE